MTFALGAGSFQTILWGFKLVTTAVNFPVALGLPSRFSQLWPKQPETNAAKTKQIVYVLVRDPTPIRNTFAISAFLIWWPWFPVPLWQARDLPHSNGPSPFLLVRQDGKLQTIFLPDVLTGSIAPGGIKIVF